MGWSWGERERAMSTIVGPSRNPLICLAFGVHWGKALLYFAWIWPLALPFIYFLFLSSFQFSSLNFLSSKSGQWVFLNSWVGQLFAEERLATNWVWQVYGQNVIVFILIWSNKKANWFLFEDFFYFAKECEGYFEAKCDFLYINFTYLTKNLILQKLWVFLR